MADKSFGVKELNLLNASGTPTVTSPNNLNLNANTVAISTSCTIGNNLTVTSTTNSANLNVTGIGTLTRGFATDLSVSGISTISQPSNANPHSLWDVVNNGASAYRFTGPGQDGAEDNPNIYLVRGQRYIFKVNASGHPFQLRVANGGAAYSDGVTNNGAQSGNVVINVQHDAPAQLYYQCTNHGGMVGNIYIVGGPQVISGVVTATTFSGSGASLTNLPAANLTGTLPAISGANLTSLPAQATIANNADNRVITGGSGVNLNGEANLTYNGTLLTATGSNEADIFQLSTGNGSSDTFAGFRGDNRSGIRIRGGGSQRGGEIDLGGGQRASDPAVIKFSTTTGTSFTEALRIDSSGRLLVSGQAALTSTSLNHPVQIAANSSAENIVCFGRASDDISAIDFYEADKTTKLGEVQYRTNQLNLRHRAAGADIIFSATPSGGSLGEKLRIASDGFLSFGGDTDVGFIRTGTNILQCKTNGVLCTEFAANQRVRMPQVYSTNGSNMRDVQIESDGTLCAGNTSVRAAKKNIVSQTDVSWLYDLNPVTFNYRKHTVHPTTGVNTYLEETLDETSYGLIAEEVESVNKDFCFYNDNKLEGVSYSQLITPLLKALQDQKREIDNLKKEVAALEGS